MRVLKFIVSGQTVKRDSKCNFNGLSPGTSEYLYARFKFGKEWDGCKVAASFWSLGVEYPVLLDADGTCIIPEQALTWSNFKVSLTGIKGNYRITTNKITVEQEG